MNLNHALFPSLMLAALLLVGITSLISAPEVVLASAGDAALPPASVPETSALPAAEPACAIGARYPDAVRRWCTLIMQTAAKYDLQPDLLAAVMLQESGGNPDALSRSGAVGLMQIMPRDGKAAEFMCKNGPCFAKRPSMAELYDPAFNLDYGARMLSGLLSRHGSLRDALKAYGPMDIGYRYADLVISILENYR